MSFSGASSKNTNKEATRKQPQRRHAYFVQALIGMHLQSVGLAGMQSHRTWPSRPDTPLRPAEAKIKRRLPAIVTRTSTQLKQTWPGSGLLPCLSACIKTRWPKIPSHERLLANETIHKAATRSKLQHVVLATVLGDFCRKMSIQNAKHPSRCNAPQHAPV